MKILQKFHLFNSFQLLKLSALLIFILGTNSCMPEEKVDFRNELTFELKSMSEYGYKGNARFRELMNGDLMVDITLEGEKSNTPYDFPAHLHFGNYDQMESPMAAMLNPVSMLSLKSNTVIKKQHGNDSSFGWKEFLEFEGHIKVHLAADGPDYRVILVAGNVGKMNR